MKIGIDIDDTLTIGNDEENGNGIRNFENWQQIYNFLSKNKIFKIIPTNDAPTI